MTVNIGQGLLNALMYMGPLAVIAGAVMMWLWERTARKKVKVIVVPAAGGIKIEYVDKEGNDVTIQNKALGVTRTWPISKLSTIPMPYPDLAGLIPRFMQREIQTTILIEDDWEPLLNRSEHREHVMSPDMIALLRELPERFKQVKGLPAAVDALLDGVSTTPTRGMIGDSAWLGALKISTTLKALASVSDDLIEALKGIRTQLARFAGLNAAYVYIGLALIIVMQGFGLYFAIQAGHSGSAVLSDKLDAIIKAVGAQYPPYIPPTAMP